MRPRRSVPLVLSCAAVAMTGCGGSSLLDGSTASDLQDSLGRVQTAIDEGRCSQARSAATDGAERVAALPSSVDAELRDRLKTGFEELSNRVGTDCETTTAETEPQVPTDTVPTDTAPETTTTEPTTPTTTPTTETPTTTTEEPPTIEPTDPADPGDEDDGSGGVVPGVDGPGASERSQGAKGLEKRLKDLRKRAEKYFKGQGGG